MANSKGNLDNLKPGKPHNGKKKGYDKGLYIKYYGDKIDALRSVPDWNDKLRAAIDQIIEDNH